MEIVSTKTRRTYAVAEKAMLLDTYKNSRTSAKQWCKENRVGLSTLQRWLREDTRRIASHPVQTWVPVVPVAEKPLDTLILQSGIFTLFISTRTDMQLFTSVLKMMNPHLKPRH